MAEKIKFRFPKSSSPVLSSSVAFGRSIFCWLKKGPFLPFFVLLLFLSFLAAPVYGFVKLPSKERMTVRVVGTKNFGEQVVFDKKVEVRVDATAGEALEQAVEIDMAGSFIETIAGIKGIRRNTGFTTLTALWPMSLPTATNCSRATCSTGTFTTGHFTCTAPRCCWASFRSPACTATAVRWSRPLWPMPAAFRITPKS